MSILQAGMNALGTTTGTMVQSTPNVFGQVAGNAIDWGSLLSSEGFGQAASGAMGAWNAYQNKQMMDLNMDAMQQNMSQSEIAFGREVAKDKNRMNAFSAFGAQP